MDAQNLVLSDPNLTSIIIQYAPYDAFTRPPNSTWRALAYRAIQTGPLRRLSPDIFRHFTTPDVWPKVATNKISSLFVHCRMKRFDWQDISQTCIMHDDIIREFANHIDWGIISRYQALSTAIIRRFIVRVDWNAISAHRDLNCEFVAEFAGCLDWHIVMARADLSSKGDIIAMLRAGATFVPGKIRPK